MPQETVQNSVEIMQESEQLEKLYDNQVKINQSVAEPNATRPIKLNTKRGNANKLGCNRDEKRETVKVKDMSQKVA